MANQSLVRYVNERRILTLLRVEGEQTRADIARRLSLTRASITHLVDGLIERRLVREMQTAASGAPRKRDLGRPGINVGLDPSGGYFLGVEIGVGTMRFALLDLSMHVADERVVRTPATLSPEEAVSEIAAHVDRLAASPLYRRLIRGGGVTVPGLVRRDGHVAHLPILGWRDVGLAQLLGKQVGTVPFLVENNANAAAFGETYLFPRDARSQIVYLKLGTGCGGAVIADGRILRGASGMAAEFGHIRIGEEGPRCNCGRLGCLEPRVNLAALRRYYPDGESDPLARIPDEWRNGQSAAIAAVNALADPLSIGLATLSNAFNPSEIVLGGAMSPVLELILEDLQKRVAEAVVPGMPAPRLSLSRLGDMQCAIGAAAIAHHEASDISHVSSAVLE